MPFPSYQRQACVKDGYVPLYSLGGLQARCGRKPERPGEVQVVWPLFHRLEVTVGAGFGAGCSLPGLTMDSGSRVEDSLSHSRAPGDQDQVLAL